MENDAKDRNLNMEIVNDFLKFLTKPDQAIIADVCGFILQEGFRGFTALQITCDGKLVFFKG